MIPKLRSVDALSLFLTGEQQVVRESVKYYSPRTSVQFYVVFLNIVMNLQVP